MQSPVESPDSQAQLQAKGSRSNEKKFICNYLPDCRAAFSRQEHLQRHIRKHTGERPFSCGCGRTFTRLDNLRQHAQTVHSGTEMSQISEEQNAIAAATKARPTHNTPPPRVDGGSDTDPYPRPLSKAVRLNQSVSRGTTPSRTESPENAPPIQEPQLQQQQQKPPQSPPEQISRQNSQAEIRATTVQPTPHPYENMSFMPSPMHTPADPTTFSTNAQSFTNFTAALRSYTPSSFVNNMQHSEVESSVGSQPISSIAKRRAPKHDFVYTGGHMMHSPATSGHADFDFSRQDSLPDEGEQMSEYINNGLEPKSGVDRSMSTGEHERVRVEDLAGMNMLSELAAAYRD